jgi:hypothetical protein
MVSSVTGAAPPDAEALSPVSMLLAGSPMSPPLMLMSLPVSISLLEAALDAPVVLPRLTIFDASEDDGLETAFASLALLSAVSAA